jgi:heme/copper-type cytochrome/quinol oxidase subunit 3
MSSHAGGFQAPLATSRSATGIPTGRLGVFWVMASEIVIFGGILASYIMLRIKFPHWGDLAAFTNVVAGGTNTFVLLTSSLFVVMAHYYAERKDTRKSFLFIWLTIGGGLCFLIIKAFEWTHEIHHGYTITHSLFWSFYYTAAGIHALHVIAGMIIMGIVSMGVRKGLHLHRVENMGIYWHFVDVVWIFLFPLLYIAK